MAWNGGNYDTSVLLASTQVGPAAGHLHVVGVGVGGAGVGEQDGVELRAVAADGGRVGDRGVPVRLGGGRRSGGPAEDDDHLQHAADGAGWADEHAVRGRVRAGRVRGCRGPAAAVAIAAPAQAAWQPTSDRRLKRDIVPVRW